MHKGESGGALALQSNVRRKERRRQDFALLSPSGIPSPSPPVMTPKTHRLLCAGMK
jgi:hypothetical protein